MELFPDQFTFFLDRVDGPANIVGVAFFTNLSGGSRVSFAGANFEGVLHNELMNRLYGNRDTCSYAYIFGSFYQIYFDRLKPVEECTDYTYLFGRFTSSEASIVKTPKIMFNEENSNFLGLVNQDCFKGHMFTTFADKLSRAIDAGKGQVDSRYYPCIFEGKLGICFNAHLVM